MMERMFSELGGAVGGWVGLMAQAVPGVPAPGTTTAAAPWYVSLFASPLFPLVLGLLVLYLFVFRSKKKQEKERQKLLDAVKKGDQIETIGGILGTVLQLDEKSVVLKVDETANVKMRFNRRAIHRVVVEDAKSEK